MTRCDRGRTCWLLAAAALLAGAVACTDRAGPTAPPDTRADVLAAAQPNKPKGPTPKIKSLSLGTTTLAIGGASFVDVILVAALSSGRISRGDANGAATTQRLRLVAEGVAVDPGGRVSIARYGWPVKSVKIVHFY